MVQSNKKLAERETVNSPPKKTDESMNITTKSFSVQGSRKVSINKRNQDLDKLIGRLRSLK